MLKKRVVLLGNPNSGKSTLFNALTGGRQRIGNWSGVTVECQQGICQLEEASCKVFDLPGTYALTHIEQGAIDEHIACEFLWTHTPDLIINVVDASHLERHLYLTSQILEWGYPVIVVLNMIDLAQASGLSIDLKQLSAQFHCPVVAMNSHKKDGLEQLKTSMAAQLDNPKPALPWIIFPEPIEKTTANLEMALGDGISRGKILALLENDHIAQARCDALVSEHTVMPEIKNLEKKYQDGVDIAIADARYQGIQSFMTALVSLKGHDADNLWQKTIDNIVLNRFLALPIFLLMMYTLFFFAINVGGVFQDFFDMTSDALFVQGFAQLLQSWHAPDLLIVILTAGLGKGINTTLTFIPIIFAMFFFLAFLEDSGYMARATFVIDRVMRFLGLPGKSFVPMIVGFGCNVPAVMAARTLSHRRDRILTIMMSPFMSCSARLAIYAIFTSAFFPRGGQNIVFALYLIGIGMAVFTGFLLRVTILQGKESPLILELPAYHLPTLRVLFESTWHRSKAFLFRAGKMIIPVCLLIGCLGALDSQGNLIQPHQQEQSILANLGRSLTPIFHPMGIKDDNWPATVGLLTGVLAKEVVIATLDTLYLEAGHLTPTEASTPLPISTQLKQALLTIPSHILELPAALINPILASVPEARVNRGVFGVMIERFAGPASAFAYLLFVLLYIPCVSTMAVIYRELNFRWAFLSVLWNTGIAYLTAVAFYQASSLF
jgi:ferrous iron transport protein B